MAVYDCFMFNNELDILEIRLNILDPIVDFFVIAESNRTFSGLEKPYYFKENEARFAAFAHKIIHIATDDSLVAIPGNDPWILENAQRQYLMRGVAQAKDSDLIILSDADEIPDPAIFNSLTIDKEYVICIHQLHVYALNNIQVSPKVKVNGLKNFWYALKGFTLFPNLTEPYWLGTCIFRKSLLNKYSFQDLRNISRAKRIKGTYITNAGWHFSYVGNADFIKLKLDSHAHQEFNTESINNKENIEQCLKENKSLVDEAKFNAMPINDNRLPVWLRENHKKYAHLFFPADK